MIVFGAEKRERRDERAGADARDDGEFRPCAGLCPAAENPGREGAVIAAAREGEVIHGRVFFILRVVIGVCGLVFRDALFDGEGEIGRGFIAPVADVRREALHHRAGNGGLRRGGVNGNGRACRKQQDEEAEKGAVEAGHVRGCPNATPAASGVWGIYDAAVSG